MTGGSTCGGRLAQRAGDLFADVLRRLVDVPLEDEPDRDARACRRRAATRIWSTPATPLSACSSGSATDELISSGLAPGSAHVDGDGGRVGLRQQVDAEIAEGEQARHDQRHDQHGRECRAADAEFGETHRPASPGRVAGGGSWRDCLPCGQAFDVVSHDRRCRRLMPSRISTR